MLIIKAFVNHRQIDEIQIQNVGHHSSGGQYRNYKLIKPDIPGNMVHCRDKGWEVLAVMALKEIIRAKEVGYEIQSKGIV